MNFEELKQLLWKENDIERVQRIEGHNVNDQNLPYEEIKVPRMPKERFFKEGNIFINKHHRYSKMPAHTHEFVEFNYMLSGSCVQYVNGEKITLNQGEILLLDKEIVQRIDVLGENDILINILLKGESITTDLVVNRVRSNGIVNEFLMNASNDYGSHSAVIHFPSGHNENVQLVMQKLILEYYNKKNDYMRSMNLLMSLLIIELTRAVEEDSFQQQDDEIVHILRYIEVHYRTVALKQLSAHFGYNLNYISNKLKKETGKSFKELLNYTRYKASLELIKETDKSFEEIAYEVGYETVSSLYKLFAKFTTDTPKELRKSLSNHK